MDHGLDAVCRRILEEELALHGTVLDALRDSPTSASAAEPSAIDSRAPYFAHLSLLTAGRRLELLLGSRTFVDRKRGVHLVDWREAPLAAVFFGYEPGETYEEEHDDRLLRGELLDKRILRFEGGELWEIQTREHLLQRDSDSERWLRHDPRPAVTLDGGEGGRLDRLCPRDRDGRKIPVVTDLLDQTQREALQQDERRPLMILGGAGSGKTTVALHRLAWLHHQDPRRYAQQQMLVVVPEEGLARLTAAILAELGLGEIQVRTFDAWIAEQARRLFADLRRPQCEDAPGRVVRLKRHPALRDVLPLFVERLTRALAERLDRKLAARGALTRQLSPAAPPLQWLDHAETLVLRQTRSTLTREVRALFADERRRLHTAYDDLLALFGDRDLLTHAAQASRGDLTPAAVEETLLHTRRQLATPSDEVFAHVDADRRQSVDGYGLDHGTPEALAGSVDLEDYAVALELLRLKTGGLRTRRGALSTCSHLVLDEAQELCPIELSVLGRTLRRGSAVTICGDQAQQIDPSSCFADWAQALRDLGATHAQAVHLQTSYRCTRAVTTLAHQVLGPLAPSTMPLSPREGTPVARTRFDSDGPAAHALIQALADLTRRQPAASVAVITASTATAQRWYPVLKRTLPVRLVLQGAFSFRPGIDVTTVQQVKGLEFDVVVLPDVSRVSYPDQAAARRKLHVACTRAIQQLWLMEVGPPSPLLPEDRP